MKVSIELLKSNNSANIYRNKLANKSIDIMPIQIENKLNPKRYHLSDEAKRRLKWMYIIKYECNGNISKSARRIGVSRQWLSVINSKWYKSKEDPRQLEPSSKAPHNTDKRKKISKEDENTIIKVRNKYHWGKDKVAVVLKRDYGLNVGATTVNRYLHKHNLIDIKLSNKNRLAWARSKTGKVEPLQKTRPPKKIKDYKPGALIEKDMKFILKKGCFLNPVKYKAKENFWYQHTFIDSFTRIRFAPITKNADSATAAKIEKQIEKKFPFKIACVNTDSGGENGKHFANHLREKEIVHFFSRAGTPTDNPRVERSHVTDDREFYSKGNLCSTFTEQVKKKSRHDHIYNYIRPHQALGYLTPIEFHKLWRKDPDEAYAIVDQYQKYLIKNKKRLVQSRQMKKKEKIEQLMKQIDEKLGQ